MFTSQLAIDLVLVVLGTGLMLLVLAGIRSAVRRLRQPGAANTRPGGFSPALALAMALVVMVGVHVIRTGVPPAEAFDGRERPGASHRPDAQHVPGAVAVGPVSARIGTIMGRSTLDLRESAIGPGEQAVVTVFVAMGRVTLRVPDGWEIDATGLPATGAVEDTRAPRHVTGPARQAPRLVLRGIVMVGVVEVTS